MKNGFKDIRKGRGEVDLGAQEHALTPCVGREGAGGISIAGGRVGALPVLRAKIKERSWDYVSAY
jgi:hypothetical protein